MKKKLPQDPNDATVIWAHIASEMLRLQPLTALASVRMCVEVVTELLCRCSAVPETP